MKIFSRLNGCLMFALSILTIGSLVSANEKSEKKIPENGKFVVEAKFGSDLVQVTFYTKTLNLSRSVNPPEVGNEENGCTYSRYPCSLLINLQISINYRRVRLPRSAFSGLSDINTAEIRQVNSNYILVISSGDASESWITQLEFDKKRIIKVEGFFPSAPSSPASRTEFFERIDDK